jgi:hypothetical protein
VSKLADARKALSRGSVDAALVDLWNALEPARLAGDRRTLRDIEQLALRIAEEDEGARREAERLLEAVRGAAEGDVAPATERVEGRVEVGAEPQADPVVATREDRPEGPPSRRAGLAPLIWLLVFLAVVLVNALQGR